jgi:RNA polymerase primary sigma factor
VRRTDSITTYLNEIRRYPPLTRAEESSLAVRIRAGDGRALERLVCSNLRFVVTIAKKYQNRGVALDDLIDEGNLGLIRAAEKFDESKGVKFISYAVWWIRQSIVQAIADTGHTVRVPLSRASVIQRIGRESNALRQELGREPTRHEIAEELHVSDSSLENTMPIARGYLSLDAPLSSTAEGRLLDYVIDESSPSPDAAIFNSGLCESVDAALSNLRDREATVIRLYFGFDGDDEMTLEEIGQRLGITRERVRQIKEKGLERIRRSGTGRSLAGFWP